MTFYYWNRISMGGPENGFIQEEKSELEVSDAERKAGFVFIGQGECLDDALAQFGKIPESLQKAIDRDYE